MQNILQIFRSDLHRVTRNAISVVVLFGVVVIPSFFAWFNVLSSWDPFGNVKNLKVAVANADEGYLSELFPMPVNVGDQVISNLRANNDLNWVFTSEEEAVQGTESGEYYAALVLPENFSRDMITFLAPGAQPAEIDYYSNQKENAISPEITNEAATDVSTQINASFTKTLNEVGLSLISSLAQGAGSAESEAALGRLSRSAEAAASSMNSAAVTLDMFGSLIGSSKIIVDSAASLADSAETAARSTSGTIGKGIGAADSLKSVLAQAGSAIPSAIDQTSSSYDALIEQVNKLNGDLGTQARNAAGELEKISNDLGAQISKYETFSTSLKQQAAEAGLAGDPDLEAALTSVSDELDLVIEQQKGVQKRIDAAAAGIRNQNGDFEAARAEIIALANSAKASLDGARNAYDSSLRPKLDQLAGSLAAVNGSFNALGGHLSAAGDALSGGTGSLTDFLTQAEGTTASLATDLRDGSEVFTKLSAALQKASVTGDFSEVQQLIGSNASVLAGELASPVGLKTIAVFEVDTFGAQMAPFYSVLGLWVGALLLSVLIRTDVSPTSFRPTGTVKKMEEYFGRYGIFAVLAFLQSSLLYIGLIGFVGVRPVYPALLILAGWLMSFVFSLITYTLVLSFGEAGKAFAVFLLVVQVSAGGGAYPLSVLPQWFQNISPWLPVRHATDAVRSAIGGIYEADYWISMGQLALFLVPALLIGLVLRLPVLKINNDLNRALESTKLM